MKKILFINFVDNYGGGEIYLENLITILNEKNECILITPRGRMYDSMKNNVKIYEGFSRNKKFLSLKNIKFYYKEVIKINKIIRKEKIEITILNGKSALYLSPFIYKNKIVAIKHTYLGRPAFLLKKILHKISFKYCEKVILISNSHKRQLLDLKCLKKDKVEVIYTGVNSQKFKRETILNSKTSDLKILIISRLQNIKGHAQLLYAFKNILKIHSNLTLIIAGEGEEEKNIKKIIADEKLEENVKLLGFIPAENIIPKVDIVILPSETEGIPLSIIEAMICKKAIIATNVGGIPEMITDFKNGILIKNNSVEEIEKGLLKVIENKKLRNKISKNSYIEFKNKFSMEQYKKKIELIIRGL